MQRHISDMTLPRRPSRLGEAFAMHRGTVSMPVSPLGRVEEEYEWDWSTVSPCLGPVSLVGPD